jgi:hypothetical protein
MRCVGHVACMGGLRNAERILDGRPDKETTSEIEV